MTDRRAIATRIWLAISHELGLILTRQERLKAMIAAVENELPATRDGESVQAMNAAQIKHMVDRFLGWSLPPDFNPDGGIIFEPLGNKGTTYEYRRAPTGTNLLDSTQADAMVRYMIEGLPATLAEQEVVPHSEGSTPTNRPNNTQPPPLDGAGERAASVVNPLGVELAFARKVLDQLLWIADERRHGRGGPTAAWEQLWNSLAAYDAIPKADSSSGPSLETKRQIDIVFDGPPSHESGRFVEVESPPGTSISFGQWVHREDGYWAFRFDVASGGVPSRWRPIEEAPKGKVILLFAVTDRREDGTVANWKMATGATPFAGPAEWIWDGYRLREWDVQPTHWMPLPAPPVEQTDE